MAEGNPLLEANSDSSNHVFQALKKKNNPGKIHRPPPYPCDMIVPSVKMAAWIDDPPSPVGYNRKSCLCLIFEF